VGGPPGSASGAVAPTKVGAIMTTPVISVAAHAPVTEIAETLRSHRISGVPVVDDAGVVVGLVSEYDLLAKPGGALVT
jgi:CBS domain-containing protein